MLFEQHKMKRYGLGKVLDFDKSTIPKTPKVLLVEDDPMIQRIHQQMLTDLGYETDVASNAAEALALAKNTYDLIILDIGLPDLNGIELAKRIRGYPNHINTLLLALTAYTDRLTEKNCFEAGIASVLHKPIEVNALLEALHVHHL